MQSSLQAELDNALGAGNSRVFVTADHQFDIVFCGQFGGLPMPPFALITNQLTQQISLDSNTQYGGTIIIEIPWSTGTVATAPISVTRPNQATADVIVKALTDALAMPDVLVTCQATSRGFTITLQGPGAADIPPLTLDISQLSPSFADLAITDSEDRSSGNVTVFFIADGKGATSCWLEIPANTLEGTPINIGLTSELRTNEHLSEDLTVNPFYRTILYSSNQATLKSRVQTALNDLLGAGSVAVWDGPQSSAFDGPASSLLVVFTGDFANTYLAGPQLYFDAGGTFTFLHPSITGLNFNAVSPMLPQVTFDQQTGRWFATSTLVSPEQGDFPDWDLVDDSIRVLHATRADGSTIATFVNFAAHSTVMGSSNTLISADWPGPTAEKIEAALGGTAVVMPAANGRTQPDRPPLPAPENLDVYSTTIANIALQAVAGAVPVQGDEVRAKKRLIFETADNGGILALSYAGQAGCFVDPSVCVPIMRAKTPPWIDGDVIGTVASALRVGNVLFSGTPGEPYPQIAFGIQRAVDAGGVGVDDITHHFIFSLCDDQLGYLIAPAEGKGAAVEKTAVNGNDNSLFNVAATIGDHVMCSDIDLAIDIGFPGNRVLDARCNAWLSEPDLNPITLMSNP